MLGGVTVKDFSLEATVRSGQPLDFYSSYEKKGGTEVLGYVTEKGALTITATGSRGSKEISYSAYGYSHAAAGREVRARLGLNDDIRKIRKSIDTDSTIHAALVSMRGLRVTRNPPWETALSFIVSQFNNIKRIRLIMNRLIGRFGGVGSTGVRRFPSPQSIACASISELTACNAGFRARYLRSAAEEWCGINQGSMQGMGYQKAKARLMELDGIGEKVADCILLMGYGRLEAFPVDVWIKRFMEDRYIGKRVSDREIREFAAEKWAGYAGYAQQYLYAYSRREGRDAW
jgi:N-glycosylase/DNA lyase